MDDKELEYTSYLIDGSSYVVGKTVKYNNDNYCFLINIDNPKDTFIQRYENGKFYPLTKAEDLINILLLVSSEGVN